MWESLKTNTSQEIIDSTWDANVWVYNIPDNVFVTISSTIQHSENGPMRNDWIVRTMVSLTDEDTCKDIILSHYCIGWKVRRGGCSGSKLLVLDFEGNFLIPHLPDFHDYPFLP